ncbi:MAG: large-conductance mechanosensitive channel protein MscL [Vampirovibrionales bacterium]|nr:large-conductance mechanosensitive channel protein MscL [Vampirovibrionales bacterium]
MSFVDEFKEFALKGNVMDLAVGVIIGGAFGKIVTSLVDNVIMPPVGLLMGGVDFTGLVIPLNGTVSIKYGNFIQSSVDFIILAFCIFMMVKAMNSLKKAPPAPEAPAAPAPPTAEELLTEIRDALKAKA